MSKKAYFEKLRDPRWQQRRLEIMNRDKFTCRACRTKEKTLNVHHTHYRKGADPWDYEDADLVTVCEDCHELLEHRRQTILQATANPRIQIEVMHFAMVMSFMDTPYSRGFEPLLSDLHGLMEMEDGFRANIQYGQLKEAEDALREMESQAFMVQEWLFRIFSEWRTALSSALQADFDAYKSEAPPESASPE